MKKQITIKAPAKVNLTLEIVGKREDGFHNIKSIMQTLNLYDYLTISVELADENEILLSGNSNLIPYDSKNLVYKAVEKFIAKTNLQNTKIEVYIEKNIPISAGLAGGSTDGAGVLVGLNKLFDNILPKNELHKMASQLGSDLNFCMEGGTKLATSRGEILEDIVDLEKMNFILVKPKNLSISAKEAYQKYSAMENKPKNDNTEKMLLGLKTENTPQKIAKLLNNNLEDAVISDYPLVNFVKEKLLSGGCLNAIMSGSGPVVFGILEEGFDKTKTLAKFDFNEDFEVFYLNNIKSGVKPDGDIKIS